MAARTTDICLLTLALILVACQRPPMDNAGAETVPAAVQPGGLDAEAGDGWHAHDEAGDPGEPVPPATAPGAAAALHAADLAAFVPVPFGAGEQALRAAWGRPLAGGGADGGCHYLFAQPRPPTGYGLAVLVEDGRFVRVDVDDPTVTAPGGGRVGMEAAAVAALYPGRVETRPHKYTPGAAYLRVATPGTGGVLLFETGADGRVQAWRIGVPPQVDYVEGCG